MSKQNSLGIGVIGAGRIGTLRARLAALEQTIPCGEFAPDGTLLSANAAYLALHGYTAEEVRGQHHRIIGA